MYTVTIGYETGQSKKHSRGNYADAFKCASYYLAADDTVNRITIHKGKFEVMSMGDSDLEANRRHERALKQIERQ